MAREIYEELNEQLTAELPQLIDLRVPYLDPSFEALVKIQLRFCKEGYERMAQVQQYLEPQVREDYAVVSNPLKQLCVCVCVWRLTFRGHWIKRLSRFYSR
jgi:BAR domain